MQGGPGGGGPGGMERGGGHVAPDLTLALALVLALVLALALALVLALDLALTLTLTLTRHVAPDGSWMQQEMFMLQARYLVITPRAAGHVHAAGALTSYHP